MIHAIVFDFDGVIANSEPLHLRAYQEVFEPLGVTLTRERYYRDLLGFDDEGVFRKVAEDEGWEIDEARIAALIEEKSRVMDEAIARADVLYPGAVECIERLAASFPLGIASGALRHEIETILARRRLDRHFRFIVSAEDTARGKPAPDPYARAAELHGVAPEECLAIEDSHWGIESARAAGLKCIAVTHTYPASQLQLADAVVSSLAELTPALARLL
jgi:beta-phosphoglucomutase